MASKRRFDTFSMSFLDIMSCGFGAVVLFFMIINATMAKRSDELNRELTIRAEMLKIEVAEGEDDLVALKNTIEELENEQVVAEGRAKEILDILRENREELSEMDAETLAKQEAIEKLKADLKALEEENKRLSAASSQPSDTGERIRSFTGDGDRQYLTGVRVGGERVLILLDSSSSMLDDTVVNIIRRRNLPDSQKMASPKWQRALSTAEWITTQIGTGSRFQIYAFNESAASVVPNADGWIEAARPDDVAAAVESMRKIVPGGGTSLWHAFTAAAELQPPPDNIFLIIDSLPTRGKGNPIRKTVSGDGRVRHFNAAMKELVEGVPVNVVLFPMEGDAQAASAYWKLAIATGGSFMSPSRDWP